jgi:hypothetical protein
LAEQHPDENIEKLKNGKETTMKELTFFEILIQKFETFYFIRRKET